MTEIIKTYYESGELEMETPFVNGTIKWIIQNLKKQN